jgi:hypothetical protein
MKRSTISIPQIITLTCASLLVIVLLFLNIFLVGGVDFIMELDALLPLPIAILISILLFRLWRGSVRQEISRKIWGAFLVGMLLWAIGEGIWNFYPFPGDEAPFPSVADYVWVIGYIFFFLAFTLRFRSLKVKLKRREILALVLLYAPLFLLTVFFSILPTIKEGGDSLFAIALTIFYPVADLLIPLRAMSFIFALRKGELVRPWGFLAASFLCMSVADLAITFAQNQEIYWPENLPNFISVFGDWLYIVAYVVMALGVYFVPRIPGRITRPLPVPAASPDPTRPVHKPVLILTDAKGRICYISSDTYKMLGLPATARVLGENIATVTGISNDEIAAIIIEDGGSGTSRTREVTLKTQSGKPRPAHLAVLPSYDNEKKYIGANLLLHSWVAHTPQVWEDYRRILEILRAEESLVNHNDHGALLSWYFRSQIRVLYVLVARLAGVDLAGNLMAILRRTAEGNHWAIEIGETGFDVVDSLELPLDERGYIYRRLLKLIADYAIVVASYETTEHELQFLDRTLSEEAMEMMATHGMRFPGYSPHVK